MSDRRRVKLVITAISDSDNFETNEKTDEALTEVVNVVVDDEVTLYRVLQRCRRPLIDTVEEDLKMMSDEAEEVIDNWMHRGFETRWLALQDLLLEFRDRRK